MCSTDETTGQCSPLDTLESLRRREHARGRGREKQRKREEEGETEEGGGGVSEGVGGRRGGGRGGGRSAGEGVEMKSRSRRGGVVERCFCKMCSS